MSQQQGFPGPSAPLVDDAGRVSIAWRQFLLTLWRRSGGADGAQPVPNPATTQVGWFLKATAVGVFGWVKALAADIGFTPAGTTLTSTDVQGALVELDSKKADASVVATALAGKASTATTITGTGALTGGGDLSANRTLDIAAGGVTAAKVATGFNVNRVYAEYTANADLTTLIPADDTVPQSTEGTQILSASLTPGSTTNRVGVRFEGQVTAAGADNVIAALFVNGTCVRAKMVNVSGAGIKVDVTLEFEHVPGATSAQTYTVRVGGGATTVRLNGGNTARFLGGTSAATLVAEEIRA